MSERPLPPSEKRRREARRRGDVAFSPQLSAWVAWLAGVTALLLFAPRFAPRWMALARHGLAGDVAPAALLDEAWLAAAWTLLPPALAALAGSLGCGLLQTRGLLTLRPLSEGASPRSRARREGVARPLAFATVALAATAIALRRELPSLDGVAPGAPLLSAAASLLARVALRVGAALVSLGLADFALRRIARERALGMTRAEARREQREDQVDPRFAAERRRRQRAAR